MRRTNGKKNMETQSSQEENYLEKVTDYFIQLRGEHICTGPGDWIVIKKWQSQGIPLKIVFRGMEDAASRKSDVRFTLGKCDRAIQKYWKTHRSLLQGKNRSLHEEETEVWECGLV